MRQRVLGSSHVEWIEWDPASRVLQVEYRGGRLYRYEGMDYETWSGLMRAPSKGSFLRRVVHPKFAGQAVAG